MRSLILRDQKPAIAPRPVGAGDDVASDLILLALGVEEPNHRGVPVHPLDLGARDAEPNITTVAGTRVSQVDKDVGLRV